MTSMSRFTMTIALAAGTALVPTLANAQSRSVEGSFDLPVQTQWAIMSLAPGHYTLSVRPTDMGSEILMLHGPNGTQQEAVLPTSSVPNKDGNYLRLEKVGNSYAVREFHCGTMGQEFRFHASKQMKAEEAKAGHNQNEETIIALSK